MSDTRTSIDVVIPAEVRELLEAIAAEKQQGKRRVYASDVVREAIQEYLQRRGHEIEVKVDRGGYRERKD